MSAEIISGKELAKEKREQMKQEVEQLKQKGIKPGLAVILVGEDPASQSYVRSKQKSCKEIGIHPELDLLPESISEEELLGKIDTLNKADHIHGILVQLPLPNHISGKAVIEAIDPRKD